MIFKKTVTACSLMFFQLFTSVSADFKHIKEGDLIFQTSNSTQSIAIQKVTKSIYSHMGIVFFKNNKPYVFEAANTVKYTPLEQWIKRGVKHHYVIKRLNKPLTPDDIVKLKKIAATFLGKAYDLQFLWSDQEIYCSELVWKIYDRGLNIKIGQLQKIKDFDISSKEAQQEIKERYQQLPLEETVISPQAMFESDLLSTITRTGAQ
ncbi:lipid binding hydrolase [Gammaproteobacteria bacterium]|nr:lipid binding hydrolase [Gammaproteobacteria bacterium]